MENIKMEMVEKKNIMSTGEWKNKKENIIECLQVMHNNSYKHNTRFVRCSSEFKINEKEKKMAEIWLRKYLNVLS